MAWNNLKAAVAAAIKTNGNQEITGASLQSTLNSIIDQVGANATFKGIATPSTNPGTPEGPVFYIASTQGTYANFGGFVLDGGFAILSNLNGSWGGTKLLKKEMDAKADHGYESNPKTLKQVDDSLVQLAGEMNQKIDDESARLEQESIDCTFKTMRIGASGLVTLSPTTRYFTYKLNVMNNITLTIDLQRMIEQVGNARCRLIIDMPIVRTIMFTKPILWGGTAPTFATAGQYVLEVIDVDGSGTPLVWLVASTTKQQATGNILYVDSTGANYSSAEINGEEATRTTSTWANPFKYLQNAINASVAGDVIFVREGVYKPTHLQSSPETYTAGDHLLRDATFSPKNSVDMYGGFVGTESRTWQREVDENGYPVNATILCGDILNEAVIDPLKTVGDPRTDLSKANAAYNVVMAQGRVTNITYFNGFDMRYGNADGSISEYTNWGGGINATSSQLVSINNRIYSNSAKYGGGWRDGINTNCTAYSNSASTAGGGWHIGTNTNCTAYSNSAEYGGGWSDGINTNCTAYSNSATTYGGGWREGINTNCTAYSNSVTAHGGGWYGGTNTNCTAYSNSATTYGGGWSLGTNTNCTGVNNIATQAVFGSSTSDAHINCLLFNNRNNSGTIVGFNDATATGVKIFRNNAYDRAHPTITGGAGSDIDYNTCIPNATLEQVKIEVPTVIGQATTEAELQELHEYKENILTKLRPKEGSVLKGAGVNNTTYPNPTDFEGAERPENSTIGILEGE